MSEKSTLSKEKTSTLEKPVHQYKEEKSTLSKEEKTSTLEKPVNQYNEENKSTLSKEEKTSTSEKPVNQYNEEKKSTLSKEEKTSTSEKPVNQYNEEKKSTLSKEEKTKLVCSLLQQAPPGEFSHVFEDLRILVKDDNFMRLEAAQVCAHHTRNNFTPVRIKGSKALVTRYNYIGGNRFFDPQIKLSFRFDHLSGKADKFLLHHDTIKDDAELWRATLNVALESYMESHFSSGGCRVFKKNLTNSPFFVVCIEGHQHPPSEFWNGHWKSEWTFAFTPPATQVKGNIHLHLHYFKGMNLHMTANEDITDAIILINRTQFAYDFAKLIEAEDNKFQIGLVEGLQVLSDEIWRTLRRHLSITRTVISWDKLLTCQNTVMKASGNELLKCLL